MADTKATDDWKQGPFYVVMIPFTLRMAAEDSLRRLGEKYCYNGRVKELTPAQFLEIYCGEK